MSSPGGQWRLIRYVLSASNLSAEMEKWLHKVKPVSSEQLGEIMKKFDQAISSRLKRVLENSEVKVEKGPAKAATVDQGTQSKLEKVEEQSMNTEPKQMTLDGLWQGLKLKKDLHFGNISENSWRANKPVVTKTSIHSRTAYVVSAIVTAESAECLARRTEHFIDHLKQYPEARDYAIKEGAVRALLRVQDKLDGGAPAAREVNGLVNEALALVGWVRPTRGPGPNILSLDGGGVRGLVAIELLRHLERITARPVHELFDYIIGVSTGAIIAAVIGGGVGTLETAAHMYHTLSREMFGNTTLIGGTSRLVWTHSYYDTAAWERMLRDNLGESTLTECNRRDTPKMALVSCVVNSGSRLSPFVFRSYECGFRVRSVFPGTCRARLWQAVRASAAAPTYFDEFRLEGLLHQDGGIAANNPAGVGLHEATLLFGAEAVRRGTVVSVGTGRALHNHLDYRRVGARLAADAADAPATSWRDKFNKILDSATDTEGAHRVLNDLLPPGHYYRFNPPLMEVCAMDEIDAAKLRTLTVDAHAYIRRNQHKFERAAETLTRTRGLARRLADAAHRRALIAGVI